MPRINEGWNEAILDLAEANHLIPVSPTEVKNYSVPDSWGRTKTRKAMSGFTDEVLERHKHRDLQPVLEQDFQADVLRNGKWFSGN